MLISTPYTRLNHTAVLRSHSLLYTLNIYHIYTRLNQCGNDIRCYIGCYLYSACHIPGSVGSAVYMYTYNMQYTILYHAISYTICSTSFHLRPASYIFCHILYLYFNSYILIHLRSTIYIYLRVQPYSCIYLKYLSYLTLISDQ